MKKTICGMPQGSIFDTLLLLIYIIVPSCLKSTTPYLYADFYICEETNELVDKINSDFENIKDWLAVNRLLSVQSYVRFRC